MGSHHFSESETDRLGATNLCDRHPNARLTLKYFDPTSGANSAPIAPPLRESVARANRARTCCTSRSLLTRAIFHNDCLRRTVEPQHEASTGVGKMRIDTRLLSSDGGWQSATEKVADQRCDFRTIGLQRKVTGVEHVDFRIG